MQSNAFLAYAILKLQVIEKSIAVSNHSAFSFHLKYHLRRFKATWLYQLAIAGKQANSKLCGFNDNHLLILMSSADLDETWLISTGPPPRVSWCTDCGQIGLGWPWLAWLSSACTWWLILQQASPSLFSWQWQSSERKNRSNQGFLRSRLRTNTWSVLHSIVQK